MSFTIFQNERTPPQAIKKSSKSQKIDFFPKGLTHPFGPKMAIFPTFFFSGIQARKMSFTIFQKKKTPFQAIKSRSLKSHKIGIFPTGLTHASGPKVAIFPPFFFRQYRPGKFLLRYFRTKKQEVQKVEKLTFFQRGNPWFWSKKGHFSNFFFRQYRTGKCLLRYSRTKKRLSRL